MRRLFVVATALTIVGFLVPVAMAGGPSSCRKGCLDSTAPTVQIDQPSDGTMVSGVVDVRGAANDNVKVARIDLSIDAGRFKRAQGTTAWDFSLDTTTLGSGLHQVTVRATDGAGNVAKSSVDVLVGTTPAPEPSPTPSVTPSPSPTVGPSPSVTTSPSTSPSSSPSPSPSPGTTSPPPSSTHMVTSEGVTIDVDSAGGWTAQDIYDLLKPNALQLNLIGPHLTIKVQDVYASQVATSASGSGGIYTSFNATMYLMGANSTFSVQPDAQIAHEYAHAWTLYHLYLTHNGDWSAYLNARWANSDGSVLLSGDARLDSTYGWNRREIIADDYRLLFGSALAISERPLHMNGSIPQPSVVTGLRQFLLTTWGT